jgi:hypothetical protein
MLAPPKKTGILRYSNRWGSTGIVGCEDISEVASLSEGTNNVVRKSGSDV